MRKKTHAEFLDDIGDLAEEYVFFSEYDGMDKKFEVLHKTCGNIYDVRPSSILNGHKCRYCAGTAEVTEERFVHEILTSLGEDYVVVGKFKGLRHKIEIYHRACGRTYEALAHHARRGIGCSKCSGNLKKTTSEVHETVRSLTDGEYIMEGEYSGNKHPMRIVHTECGTIFYPTYNNFVSKGSRCPTCRSSNGEKLIKGTLEELNVEYEREKIFPGLVRYRYDFYIKEFNLCVEFDGEHHFKAVEFWGGEEYLEEVRKSDSIKNDWCQQNGIHLLRIPYWDEESIPEILKRLVEKRRANKNEMRTK